MKVSEIESVRNWKWQNLKVSHPWLLLRRDCSYHDSLWLLYKRNTLTRSGFPEYQARGAAGGFLLPDLVNIYYFWVFLITRTSWFKGLQNFAKAGIVIAKKQKNKNWSKWGQISWKSFSADFRQVTWFDLKIKTFNIFELNIFPVRKLVNIIPWDIISYWKLQ